MKVIFLDIDGVLLPLLSGPEYEKLGISKGSKLDFMERAKRILKDSAVNELIRILEQTWAKIVISSSWRHHWEFCRDLLWDCRANDRYSLWEYVISKTPSKTDGGRSTEILSWIDQYHKTCKDWWHISHWIAIDDEGYDMKAIKRLWKLVKTNGHIGLSKEDADQVISILNQ